MKRFVTNLIICLFLLSFWFSVSILNFLFVLVWFCCCYCVFVIVFLAKQFPLVIPWM